VQCARLYISNEWPLQPHLSVQARRPREPAGGHRQPGAVILLPSVLTQGRRPGPFGPGRVVNAR
jgi:hypothetical protein